jgi:hypothetical protein
MLVPISMRMARIATAMATVVLPVAAVAVDVAEAVVLPVAAVAVAVAVVN